MTLYVAVDICGPLPFILESCHIANDSIVDVVVVVLVVIVVAIVIVAVAVAAAVEVVVLLGHDFELSKNGKPELRTFQYRVHLLRLFTFSSVVVDMSVGVRCLCFS